MKSICNEDWPARYANDGHGVCKGAVPAKLWWRETTRFTEKIKKTRKKKTPRNELKSLAKTTRKFWVGRHNLGNPTTGRVREKRRAKPKSLVPQRLFETRSSSRRRRRRRRDETSWASRGNLAQQGGAERTRFRPQLDKTIRHSTPPIETLAARV